MVELQTSAAGCDEASSPLSKLSTVTLPHYVSEKISDAGIGVTDNGRSQSCFSSGGVEGEIENELMAPSCFERASSEDDCLLRPVTEELPALNGGHRLSFQHRNRDKQQKAVGEKFDLTAVPAPSNQDVVLESGHPESDELNEQFSENPSPLFEGAKVLEVYAELERERKRNAELQERIYTLEAQLGIRDTPGLEDVNGTKNSKNRWMLEKIFAEYDCQDVQKEHDEILRSPEIKDEEEKGPLPVAFSLDGEKGTDTCVTWMSRDDVTAADLVKLSKDIVSDRDDSGDSDEDDCDDDEEQDELDDGYEHVKNIGLRHEELETRRLTSKQKQKPPDGKCEDGQILSGGSGEGEDLSDDGLRKFRTKRARKYGKYFKSGDTCFTRKKSPYNLPSARGIGNGNLFKKNPKTAFCPKEVKGIMEAGVLALPNAQSHTMRKVIVFASLGIRHGCEDLYDLDFSHFSVIQRGELYNSAEDPGEHVLYQQPGGRRKKFYPNKLNPVLCPVRILDEELAMRPGDTSCPTCLFLCIKYGGRTRNLPQNEYVRQRMGRNKLKSFGPLMCQMALLVHIRTGSFFFKALGITLLFMAGFPDDLVRRETKYRNLDLLQKYYRSDEDAKDEQLFHPCPPFYPQGLMVSTIPPPKTAATSKVFTKRGPTPILSKPPPTTVAPRFLHPVAHPLPTPPYGVVPPFGTLHPGMPQVLSTTASTKGTPSSECPPPPPQPHFGFYAPYPAIPALSSGMPPMAWGPGNSYPPTAFPPLPYGYQSFPNFPAFYVPPFRLFPQEQQPKTKARRQTEGLQVSDSDTDTRASAPHQNVEYSTQDLKDAA